MRYAQIFGMETPAAQVIEKCGGHRQVAQWLGLHLSQVYRFTYSRKQGGTNGLIPSRHIKKLLSRAAAAGIELEPADFFTVRRKCEAAPPSDAPEP